MIYVVFQIFKSADLFSWFIIHHSFGSYLMHFKFNVNYSIILKGTLLAFKAKEIFYTPFTMGMSVLHFN
jgi:hypothetical protein